VKDKQMKRKKDRKLRMLVLGIDALDIDLVKDWGMRNLEQKQHGSFKVPINSRTDIPS